MSRTYKDNVVRVAVEMFNALGTTEINSGSREYNELCDYWIHVVFRRSVRYGNRRKLMSRRKVQDRRRTRRELDREVLGPFIYTRKGSEAEYDHACRYEGETYGAQWADWDWYTCGSNYREDDDFDAEVERWEDSGYDYDAPWDEHYDDNSFPQAGVKLRDHHDGFTPMIDEEGYAYHGEWIPRHSNAKLPNSWKGVPLVELFRSRLI